MGLLPGHTIKSVIQVGNKEGNRCCMAEHSHTYSTWLVRKCAYWSGCLTSSIPSSSVCSLCFVIRASKTGLFPVECFLLPPRGKSNSHRLNKETLQGTSITTFVFRALFQQGWCQIRSQRRDDAFTGNNGNDRTFYARSNSQQSWKKYSTPSAFC